MSSVQNINSETFKFSELQIVRVDPAHLKPKPWVGELGFGKFFTDHMLEVDWSLEEGWSAPRIVPFHQLTLHPASKCFHYAHEVFEGMKAYRGREDGKIRLFRPELNMKRFLSGAERAMLPKFDIPEFMGCLKALIGMEQDWIPQAEMSSLYIRPAMIGTDPTLSIGRSTKVLFYVILSPVGPYFSSGLKPISLLANPKFVRSWPGGCGDTKIGANYATTPYIEKSAVDAGLQQVLWLFGDDHQLTEVGTMNIFLLTKNFDGELELITPPLDGLILPGITRQSILELTREWNEFRVTERVICMQEVISLAEEKRLLEVFGSGTACLVCPVNKISYLGQDIHIPIRISDLVYEKIFRTLSSIFYGPGTHPWSVILD